MLFLDAFFRFTAIGLIAFHIIITWRDLPRSQSLFYFILASLSLLAWLLSFTPVAMNIPFYPRLVLRILDVPQLVFAWLFALSLFQKDFKINGFHVLLGLTFCLPVLLERFVQFGYIVPMPSWVGHWINLSALTITLHMVFVTIKERSDDLLNKRRKTRLGFVVVLAIIIILIVTISYSVPILKMGPIQPTLNMMVLWPGIMWFSYLIFSVRSDIFGFDKNNPTSQSIEATEAIESLDFRDLELKEKLDKEFKTNKIYLQNNLSIPVLANKLGVSKYRLRDVIQMLGYENFSTYVNTFRIKAIKKSFEDPEYKHIPILTIALKNGFNSLSPFNRAFKSIEGITPSQFRKKIVKANEITE